MTKSPQQEVEKIRAEIERARDEIGWLNDAPIPHDELKIRATEGCQAMAAKFEAQRYLGSLASPGGGPMNVLHMFSTSASVAVRGGLDVQPVNIDGIGPMLAWAMGDSLVQHLHAKIDRLDYRPGPPLTERPARLAALKAELRTLEQREEALICQAEQSGVVIPRRPDADPTVILGFNPDGEMSGAAGPRAWRPPAGVLNVVQPDHAQAPATATATTMSPTPPAPGG